MSANASAPARDGPANTDDYESMLATLDSAIEEAERKIENVPDEEIPAGAGDELGDRRVTEGDVQVVGADPLVNVCDDDTIC